VALVAPVATALDQVLGLIEMDGGGSADADQLSGGGPGGPHPVDGVARQPTLRVMVDGLPFLNPTGALP
jgi:hypothetical protein